MFTKVSYRNYRCSSDDILSFVLVSVQRCFRKDCLAVPGLIGKVACLHGIVITYYHSHRLLSLVLMWAIVLSVMLAPSLPQREETYLYLSQWHQSKSLDHKSPTGFYSNEENVEKYSIRYQQLSCLLY